jgi:hypothetical protein
MWGIRLNHDGFVFIVLTAVAHRLIAGFEDLSKILGLFHQVYLQNREIDPRVAFPARLFCAPASSPVSNEHCCSPASHRVVSIVSGNFGCP